VGPEPAAKFLIPSQICLFDFGLLCRDVTSLPATNLRDKVRQATRVPRQRCF
jgi:hypothetical protein